jgi:hypothetical protein
MSDQTPLGKKKMSSPNQLTTAGTNKTVQSNLPGFKQKAPGSYSVVCKQRDRRPYIISRQTQSAPVVTAVHKTESGTKPHRIVHAKKARYVASTAACTPVAEMIEPLPCPDQESPGRQSRRPRPP